MTRINCVPPSELHYRHLLAEIRELPRMVSYARLVAERGVPAEIPATYRMGEGHVKFFLDKGEYLERRYRALVEEAERRGYRPRYRELPEGYPEGLRGDWVPDEQALATNRARLSDRLAAMARRRQQVEQHR